MVALAALSLGANGVGSLERIGALSGRRGIMVRLRGGRCDVRTTATPGHRMRSRTASNLAATSRTRPVAEIHDEGLPTRDGTALLAWTRSTVTALHRTGPPTTARLATNWHGRRVSKAWRTDAAIGDNPVSNDAFGLEPPPGNHPPRQMTNASSLGTASAHRKTPRSFRSTARGAGRRLLAPTRSLEALSLAASLLARRTPPLSNDGFQVCTTSGIKLRALKSRQDLDAWNHRCLARSETRQRGRTSKLGCPSASMS